MALLSTTDPLSKVYDLALVDLDGVTYRGPIPIPGAITGLAEARAAGMQLIFCTNNASRTAQNVADQLSGMGIATQAGEVLTSALAAADLAAKRLPARAKVLVVGGEGLRQAVTAQGFELVNSAEEQPAAVIQGFDPSVNWSHLAEAAYAVAGGAWHLASNRDLSIPTARGYAPGNGTLVGAVVHATGVEPDSAGKPNPAMYELAVGKAAAQNPLVVGDRLDTDLAGAVSAGYPGLHVLTGVNTARDAILAPARYRPSYFATSLEDLNQAHTAPQKSGDWWVLGEAAARVVDGGLELRGEETLDLAKAAANAVWETADAAAEASTAVDPQSVPEFADLADRG